MYPIIALVVIAVVVLLLGFKKAVQAYVKWLVVVMAGGAIVRDDVPGMRQFLSLGASPNARLRHSAYKMQPGQVGGGLTTIRIQGVSWVVWSDDIHELNRVRVAASISMRPAHTRHGRTVLWQRDPNRRLGTGPLLTYAILLRRSEAIQALLDAGADVNAVDCYGQTALMMAAWQGDVVTTRSLLAKGADPKLRDRSGRTARGWAKVQGCRKVMVLLDSY